MKMKNSILTTGVAIAFAMLAGAPVTARAAEQMKPMKGGEHLLMLQEIQTKQQVDALKTDDTIAMVCAKCKTVWVTRVKQGVKGAQILSEHGQKHSCKACGDDSAFCCATKPGTGATKGMEKK